MFLSFDDGDNWQPLQLNLPHTPVSWLTIQEHFNDLVLSTYGPGILWVLDDLSPFQQLTAEAAASDAFLFAPRSAYRLRLVDNTVREMADDPTAGDNPPYGASLSYWLGSEPPGDVTLEIADSNGSLIASVDGAKKHGH